MLSSELVFIDLSKHDTDHELHQIQTIKEIKQARKQEIDLQSGGKYAQLEALLTCTSIGRDSRGRIREYEQE